MLAAPLVPEQVLRQQYFLSIDYARRVEEVLLTLNGEFGVGDRQAVEILLASKIECDLPYPWMVLEIPFYSLYTDKAWFSYLSGPVLTLPSLRLPRSRNSNDEVLQLLADRDVPRVFVEPHWEVPAKTRYHFQMWPYLMQECLRLRVTHPKSLLVEDRAGLALGAGVARLLDSRWRGTTARMPKPPVALPYYAELLQRVSPFLRNWEALLGGLCALAGRRAYLFDREVEPSDWDAVSRVMKDSIPVWITDLLGAVRSQGRFRSLRGKYHADVTLEAMKYLGGQGVIWRHQGDWRMRNNDGIDTGINELMQGIEFN